MTIKFSQFLNGVVPRTTDIVVGLRGFPAAPLNERFNFTGVADTSGNNIASWSTAGALAVNYLDFKNSLTTLGPTIAAVGTDAAINLNIGGKGNSSYTQFLGTRAIAVPAGTTAEELTGIVGGLRYDTDTDYLRYWDIGANAWVDIIAGAAYDDATYVTNTDETANLPNSQPLSALASGLMFVTTTTGIVSSIALPLGATNGGTGQSTYALGDTLYSSAANTLSKLAGNITTAKQFLSQTGTGAVSAAPVWATISGGDITGAALTRTDDTNVTLTLGGSPSTALLNATSITAGWAGQLSLTRGGTNASLVASNGGIVYSTATAMAILSGTATANQMLQSGASGAPSWSTATWPSTAGSAGTILRSNGTNWVNSTATFADTYTASNLLYSNGANTVTGLATANSAALVTSSTGVPVWSSTMTDGQVIIGSTGATPVAASLTAGSGIAITPGAGTITIAATGGGGDVDSVNSGTGINVDNTDPINPIVNLDSATITTLAYSVQQSGSPIYGADAGGTDAYAITLSPIPSAYATGMVINFKANTANTGGATLNVNSLGATTILKLNNLALETGDIEAGQIVSVVYDGTNFQMQTPVAVAPPLVEQGAYYWIVYNTVTTTAIISSYNVTSVTDTGVGSTTVTFTVAFSSTDYSAFASDSLTPAGAVAVPCVWVDSGGNTAVSAASISILTVNPGAGVQDVPRVCSVGFQT